MVPNVKTPLVLERSPSDLSCDDAASRIQAHYRGYKVRQRYSIGSRTETMRLLTGDYSSKSLTSQFSEMKKNRSGRYSIPWLYIIGANSVLVNIILAWVFMNVPDTSSNGIDHHRFLGHSTRLSRAMSHPDVEDTFIGFMVLGANRTVLKKSMNQRIDRAFDKWIETCNRPGYQGVFFPTGNNNHPRYPAEAQYIEEELLEKYKKISGSSKYRNLKAPIINQEGRAQFTVDNFLKTIPKIGDYQRKYGIEFKVVFLVTNEYHMKRSLAIANQFEEHGLVDYTLERCDVPRRVCTGSERDAKLDEPQKNGKTFEQNIRDDTDRDIKNSKSFARAIFMQNHRHAFSQSLLDDAYQCDQFKYAKANCGGNNKWALHKDAQKKLDQFDALSGAFGRLYSKSHSCTGKCGEVEESILEQEDDIDELLNELKMEWASKAMSFCNVFGLCS